VNVNARGDGPDALEIEHLAITYRVRGMDRLAVRAVAFRIGRQESFGLVGESGCGKSTTALAITRYLPSNGRISAGSITLSGRDVMSMSQEDLRQLRARSISVVYQEPGRALNPSMQVGRQVAEVFEILGAGKRAALARAKDALGAVQIADPSRIMNVYPHQLSGGMLQRVLIAMAIAKEPKLLILDEATTALDSTTEAEILDLISNLRERFGTALLVISHNLAVIARMCDRVGVMYAGEIVEQGRVRHVFDDPRHPYTVGLLRCAPRLGNRKDLEPLDTIPGFLPAPGELPAGCTYAARCALADDRCRIEKPPEVRLDATHTSRCFKHAEASKLPWSARERLRARPERHSDDALVRIRHLSKTFASRHGPVRALVDIDLELFPGETLGLVGESGSGKTTLARVVVGLTSPDPGSSVELLGRQVRPLAGERTRGELRSLQILFQNPDSALNRSHSVRHILGRSLAKLAGLNAKEQDGRLVALARSVRIEPSQLSSFSGQLSVGLKQRVAIARAFASSPAVLVCDEPTSALDVSVQAAILNLLVDLQAREGVTYLFISHDLGIVRYLSDRIAVLYLGRIMEYGPAELVFAGPHHPYTEALLSAVPTSGGIGSERIRLHGDAPSPSSPPPGCVFHTRCHRRLSDGTCETVEPTLREIEPGRFIRCHLPVEQLGQLEPTRATRSSSAS
jgi:peptide/nickel transport system ATP-binding protein